MEDNKNSYSELARKMVEDLISEYEELKDVAYSCLPQDILTDDVWDSLYSSLVNKWSYKIEELMEEK